MAVEYAWLLTVVYAFMFVVIYWVRFKQGKWANIDLVNDPVFDKKEAELPERLVKDY
jgi:hypothetical protein